MNWLQSLMEYIRRGGAFEYRPPAPPKPGRRLRQGVPTRRNFYVHDEYGNFVPLDDALAELGLVADGK